MSCKNYTRVTDNAKQVMDEITRTCAKMDDKSWKKEQARILRLIKKVQDEWIVPSRKLDNGRGCEYNVIHKQGQ